MATPLASAEPEVQDGGGSGLAIGISLVVLLALGVVLWVAVASVTGITPGLVTSIAEAGGVVVAGGIAGGVWSSEPSASSSAALPSTDRSASRAIPADPTQ